MDLPAALSKRMDDYCIAVCKTLIHETRGVPPVLKVLVDLAVLFNCTKMMATIHLEDEDSEHRVDIVEMLRFFDNLHLAARDGVRASYNDYIKTKGNNDNAAS